MKLILSLVTSFIILSALLGYFLYDNWMEKDSHHLEMDTAVLVATHHASIEMYQLATEVIYAEIVQKPEVINTFAQGLRSSGAEQDEIRNRLYRMLYPTYQRLKSMGIVLVHFHSADADSFLRLHLPEKFGDHLAQIRPSLRIANTEKRVVTGFELGRVKSGFRYVYPISKDGVHLGSLELSISFDQFRDAMSRIDKTHYYDLVLNREAVFKVLNKGWRSSYPESEIHTDYVNDRVFADPTQSPQQPAAIKQINSVLKQDLQVHSNLHRGEPFTIHVSIESGDWDVSFVPLEDLVGEKVGYSISYYRDPFASELFNDFIVSLLLGITVLLILCLFIWKLLQSQDKLKSDKQHLATITNTIGDGLYALGPGGVVTQINQAFTDLLGYEEEDVIGQVGHNIFHVHSGNGFELPLHECPIYKTTIHGNSYFGEEHFRHKSGHLVTVEITSKPFGKEGHWIGSVSAFRDITEKKESELEKVRLQNELQQAQKMESLGHLTGGIAHDFNNLLGIINGYAGLAQEKCLNQEDGVLTEYVQNIKEAGKRATTLVTQMLSFSRGDQSEDIPIQFAPLINDEIKMLRSTLPSTIEIKSHIDLNLPNVFMNPTKLHQILMNLSVNARDAMNGEGELTIRLHWAHELDIESTVSHKTVTGDWIELSVSDTGSGMDSEIVKNIFNPFFTTKEVGKGTGMGLSVIYRIMEDHGGHILLESEPGKGSTFRMLFPPILDDSVSPLILEQEPVEIPEGDGSEILVVDDEPMLAFHMSELVNNHGYEATMETDSTEALTLFSQAPDRFSMVITDQTMPKMTGAELIEKLREIRPELPAIMCSGFSDKIDLKAASELNIVYINKPVDVEKLLLKIPELLSNKSSEANG